MSDIPRARVLLRNLAVKFPEARDDIKLILPWLDRKEPIRKARARRGRPSPAKIAEVEEYFHAFPEESFHEIAEACDVAESHVSYIVNGHYGKKSKVIQ